MTKSPNQAAAQAWHEQVLSPAGQAVFVKDGFLPLTAPVPTITKVSAAKTRRRRDAHAHRHELQGHDLGHLPGGAGEVQGRLADEAHADRPGEGEDGLV